MPVIGYNAHMKQNIFDQFPALNEIPDERFPKHVAIIPDGNGRWAKKQGKFVTFGHRKGFQVAYQILDVLSELPQIKTATIWGFSADNWKRSEKEVSGLMAIFGQVVKKITQDLQERNGRFVHIGRKDRLPLSLKKTIEKAENETKSNTGQIVCLAIDFGGEDQEVRLVEQARLMDNNKHVDQEVLWQMRDGNGVVKSADLLIRTSGEQRISDIGWLNGANTELYFTPKLFPDISSEDIVEAIVDFSKRERRFGGRSA